MSQRPAAVVHPGLVLPPGAFRLVLASVVVLSHLSHLDIGRLAVLLFFYLSGYWTSRIWAEKFLGRPTGWFYLSRYLRIAPLYLLIMLAAAVARHMEVRPENLMLVGVASTLHDPTHVAWSLDVELQFYLLLPFVAGAVAVTSTTTALIGAVVLWVVGLWLNQVTGAVSVAMYMPAFVLGVLTYARSWRPSARAAGIGAGLFVAATIATAFTPFISKDIPDPFDRDIYALFWMLPLLPYVARSLTVRSSRLDRHMGNLSYPLYLVHFPVISLLSIRLGQSILANAALAVLSLAVATAIYLAVDRPVDRWRVRFTESTPPPARSLAGEDVQQRARAKHQADRRKRQPAA